MYTFLIIFIAACVIVYFAMALIFYRAMLANRNDEQKENSKMQSSRPQASRIPPRMIQKGAREAGVYHALPVQENGIVYTVSSAPMNGTAGEVHYATASDTTTGRELWKTQFYSREYIPDLETDVQNIFIVDLYVTDQHVCIKPEHGALITIEKQSGKLLYSH